MKWRQGFVSNSSSQSFVVIKDADYEYNDFKKDMGVKKNTPLESLCRALWHEMVETNPTIVRTIEELKKEKEGILTWGVDGCHDNPEKLREIYENTIAHYSKYIKKGKVIYFGCVTNENILNEPLSFYLFQHGIAFENKRIKII